MPKSPNKYVEALKDEVNLIGMGALFAACAVTAPVLFPFIALPLEAAYLLFAPDSGWFRKRLSRKYDAEIERRRRAVQDRFLPQLAPQDQVRFSALEDARRDIAAQENPSLGQWYREVLRQLDYLIEKFLVFGAKKMEYRRYITELAATRNRLDGELRRLRLPRLERDESGRDQTLEAAARVGDVEMMLAGIVDSYEREVARIDRELKQEQDPQTREVLEKNQDVLRRSRESAEKIGKLLRNLDHQLELVVNTFSLINTQVRSSTPEQILEDVSSVVEQSESLTETLATFAPMDEAVQRLGRINAG